LESKEEIQQYFDEWEAKSRSTQLNKAAKIEEKSGQVRHPGTGVGRKEGEISGKRERREKASSGLEINTSARRGGTEGSGPFAEDQGRSRASARGKCQ